MDWVKVLLLANLGATWFMTGVIWFVQVVHYPSFAGVGGDGFAAYHRRHTRRTTVVVLPPMVVEAGTAVALAVWPPAGVGAAVLWAGAAAVVAIWASTFLVQAPCHDRLAGGFDAQCHRRLCATNWLRTALWSGRAAAMAYVAYRVLR